MSVPGYDRGPQLVEVDFAPAGLVFRLSAVRACWPSRSAAGGVACLNATRSWDEPHHVSVNDNPLAFFPVWEPPCETAVLERRFSSSVTRFISLDYPYSELLAPNRPPGGLAHCPDGFSEVDERVGLEVDFATKIAEPCDLIPVESDVTAKTTVQRSLRWSGPRLVVVRLEDQGSLSTNG